MQTHEWEALLEGTTPRPWVIGVTPKDPLVDVSARTYEDARLVSHVHASVSEVVRLHRAITNLRDDYLAHIADYDEATVTHMCYGTAADDLTRILEGEA